MDFKYQSLRVQVLDNDILGQNLHYNSYYAKLKYQIIGYMDPLETVGFPWVAI